MAKAKSTTTQIKSSPPIALGVQKPYYLVEDATTDETNVPPPPLELSIPAPINSKLENIGLPAHTAKTVSNTYLRSCHAYRKRVISRYEQIGRAHV